MDETTRIENMLYESTDSRSVNAVFSSPTAPGMKASGFSQFPHKFCQFLHRLVRYPEVYATKLYSFLKIVLFLLLLLGLILILIEIGIEQGIVIMPFEVSKDANISGIAIADEITAELSQIQTIYSIKNEEIAPTTDSSYIKSLNKQSPEDGEKSVAHPAKVPKVVPKGSTVEFGMLDIGSINMGSSSLSIGNIIATFANAFANVCPWKRPVIIIRGSLQRYGSTIVLAAVPERGNADSYMISQPIEDNNNEQLQKMIKNLSFMIALDSSSQSGASASTWESFKNYTEALDAYNQYNLSRNPDYLSLAGERSIDAIKSDRVYKSPFDLLLKLESAYVTINRQNDSIEYCKKTIDLDLTSPYIAEVWNNEGIALYRLGNYSGSIEAYDEAIRLDPQYGDAWENKGFALDANGKYDEASKAYDEAIKAYIEQISLDPNNYDAWNKKGIALDAEGEYDNATQSYDKAIRLRSNIADFWNNKGFALAALGKNDEAIKAYDEAIWLEPNYVDAWDNKGIALYNLKNYEEAIKAYDEAIRLNPQYGDLWYNKGLALADLGRYDEAIQAYDEAIRLDPSNYDAWDNKGLALADLGRYDEAIRAYDEALRLNPMAISGTTKALLSLTWASMMRPSRHTMRPSG